MTLAFAFPGQGSQSVGMQADLPATFESAARTWNEASDQLGFDLLELVSDGPAEQLNETTFTQPAMLTAGVATWRAWLEAGGAQPGMMAGHSLGEYSALVCAGALEFSEALGLVKRRAELMHNAVPAGEGGMAAILGLDDDALLDVCDTASGVGVAEPVNFNSPGQVVVAGHRVAIQRLVELAREAGARRAVMLAVSVPSHSSLMRPAGDALAEYIDAAEFREPAIPVVCAVDGKPYGDVDDIRSRLKQQVYSPVHWVQTVEYLVASGVTRLAECGPGKVLTGLNRRIDRGLAVQCLDSAASLRDLLDEEGQ